MILKTPKSESHSHRISPWSSLLRSDSKKKYHHKRDIHDILCTHLCILVSVDNHFCTIYIIMSPLYVHGIRSCPRLYMWKRNHMQRKNQVHSFSRSPGFSRIQRPCPAKAESPSFEHAKVSKDHDDHVSWCHMEISIPSKRWWKLLGEAEHEGCKMLEDAGNMLGPVAQSWVPVYYIYI